MQRAFARNRTRSRTRADRFVAERFSRERQPKSVLWIIAVLVFATLAAYGNSFVGDFIFDDISSIPANPNIKHLWPLWPVLSPMQESTALGRPLLNLTFAINYSLGGVAVFGYHAFNFALHVANALLVFEVLRRTFVLPTLREKFGSSAVLLAFSVAILWAVHPLQTESVTYIVQRAESLVSFFYLMTLYCVVRAFNSGRSWIWQTGAVFFCLLGMSAKEVMVTAPVIVIVYDGIFLTGSYRDSLRRRAVLYSGLALTWVLLAYLVASTGALSDLYSNYEGPRGGSDTWSYAATQPGVLLHYLRLSVWPDPLVLDYGWSAAKNISDVIPAAVVILVLATVTIWGVLSRKSWGFLGAWFFLILSPTSSIVPLGDDFIFEHRMYLALAAPITGLVLLAYLGVEWCVKRGWIVQATTFKLGIGVLSTVVLLLCMATFQRNKAYANELSIWKDTVEKSPKNPRALNNYGGALTKVERPEEAIKYLRAALTLKPDYADALNNLGFALGRIGRTEEAIPYYQRALQLKPRYALSHHNLGLALATLSRTEEAIAHFRKAIQLQPGFPGAHTNLGNELLKLGKTYEAVPHYLAELRLRPNSAVTHFNLGVALSRVGDNYKAVDHYRAALKLKPDYAEAYVNLGVQLAGQGKPEEAILCYRKAIEIKPGIPDAHNNLGFALAGLGRTEEAILSYRVAIKLKPDFATARANLTIALAQLRTAPASASRSAEKFQPQ